MSKVPISVVVWVWASFSIILYESHFYLSLLLDFRLLGPSLDNHFGGLLNHILSFAFFIGSFFLSLLNFLMGLLLDTFEMLLGFLFLRLIFFIHLFHNFLLSLLNLNLIVSLDLHSLFFDFERLLFCLTDLFFGVVDFFLGRLELVFEVSIFMGNFFELVIGLSTVVILACDFKFKVSNSFPTG